jgi:copper(I)-binding protein
MACVFLLMLASPRASADTGDTVRVSDAWVRETVPGQSTGTAYLRIRSSEPLELVGLKSTVSKTAELHRMSMKDDVMRMREATAVAVTPDKELQLAPNGTHIMLVDLKRSLKAGDVVDLKLIFRRANGDRLVVPVRAGVKSIAEETMHGH